MFFLFSWLIFLKSICGGTSKIYAGLYDGTPVQIYPSVPAELTTETVWDFNVNISIDIFTNRESKAYYYYGTMPPTNAQERMDYIVNAYNTILVSFSMQIKFASYSDSTTNSLFGGIYLGNGNASGIRTRDSDYSFAHWINLTSYITYSGTLSYSKIYLDSTTPTLCVYQNNAGYGYSYNVTSNVFKNGFAGFVEATSYNDNTKLPVIMNCVGQVNYSYK